MKKIPTLFKRDPENMKRVIPEVRPDCQWVLNGEGVATRKYDGTCVLIRRDGLAARAYVRREVKKGKDLPLGFLWSDFDETTGKRVGWEPAEQSGFFRFVAEAMSRYAELNLLPTPGTYELCGPKINGNPEGFSRHYLVSHTEADRIHFTLESGVAQAAYIACRAYLLSPSFKHEGIVWHHIDHVDGRMAKLKVKDFA